MIVEPKMDDWAGPALTSAGHTEDPEELLRIAASTLRKAAARTEVEVALTCRRVRSARVRADEPTVIVDEVVSWSDVRVWENGGVGCLSVDGTDGPTLTEAVAVARDLARLPASAGHAPRPVGDPVPRSGQLSPALLPSTEAVRDWADRLLAAVRERPEHRGTRGVHGLSVEITTALASTTGFAITGISRGTQLSSTVLCAEDGGDGHADRLVYGYTRTPEAGTELSAERLAASLDDATTDARATSDPLALPARLTVLTAPVVTARLLGALARGRLQAGAPWPATPGERITSPGLDLVEQPGWPASPQATDHDGEGFAARPRLLLTDGIVTELVHTSETAAWAGCRPEAAGGAVRRRGTWPRPGLRGLRLRPTAGAPYLTTDATAALRDDGVFEAVRVSGVGDLARSERLSLILHGRLWNGGRWWPMAVSLSTTWSALLAGASAVAADEQCWPSGIAGPTLELQGLELQEV